MSRLWLRLFAGLSIAASALPAVAAERVECPDLAEMSETLAEPPPAPWTAVRMNSVAPELSLVTPDPSTGTPIAPQRRYHEASGWWSVWALPRSASVWAVCDYGGGARIAKPLSPGLDSCHSGGLSPRAFAACE